MEKGSEKNTVTSKSTDERPENSELVDPSIFNDATSAKDQANPVGKSSTLVASSVLEGSAEESGSGEGGTHPSSTTPGLRDWAKVVQMSSRFAEVSIVQIERVRMMRDRILEGARFSFNYNILLLAASVIAGLGLVSNSSTTVIASMLVSPIMGPVVAMAYGTTIFDRKMIRVAVVTELVSLIFCIAIGAILGVCTGNTDLADDWPTNEMMTRGEWQNFYVALPVAFFSGLGVAVSLLDDQTNSLVGVAISASLLPPAVNAGILWVAYGFVNDERLEKTGTERDDFREAGVISLLLTLANIVIVWFASVLMFRIKEVLPVKKKNPFWNDLGVARKIYQNKAYLATEEVRETEDATSEGPASPNVNPPRQAAAN